MNKIEQILNGDNLALKKALFLFNKENTREEIVFKFGLWSRYFFPTYFTSDDADFHNDVDLDNLRAYYGDIRTYTDIVFRGGAKTSRTKLFIAFCLANDENHYRKYIKILSSDIKNSTQIVTDIYNMLVTIKELYPEIFAKTDKKRQETQGSFKIETGPKVRSGTVRTEQRGTIQEESRPDLQWFEDFESRKTLRSAIITQDIWANMEEARTGQAEGKDRGSCIYTCNYISEAGNVHKLVQKESNDNIVTIIPMIKDDVIAWDRYNMDDINYMKDNDDDYEGERLCNPASPKSVYFNRDILNKMETKEPIKDSAGFKIFHEYDPSCRFGSGHDISGGVRLDSSTSVFINFSTVPARVCATYRSNTIKPDAFGHEIYRQNNMFGGCITAPENNYGTEAILILKQKDVNLYTTQVKNDKIEEGEETRYGWNTNILTKPEMLSSLFKAIEQGLLDLVDKELIQEFKSYTKNDLIENVKDPRLTTRHFDLLMACGIAWMMKDHAKLKEIQAPLPPPEVLYDDIGI